MTELCNSFLALLGLSPESSSTSFTQSVFSGTVLSQDWPYYPLLSLYNSNINPSDPTPSKSPVTSDLVLHSLSWLSLLPPTSITSSTTSTWTRLATVFLCPGSLFLSPEISCVLHLNLVKTLSRGKLDLAQSVPGVTSNPDFYSQLVDQFISESYGDHLFSLFIMLPLGMNQPPAFR